MIKHKQSLAGRGIRFDRRTAVAVDLSYGTARHA
jgi:hypothetical protein